jgi:hypothetical protein
MNITYKIKDIIVLLHKIVQHLNISLKNTINIVIADATKMNDISG